MANKNIRFVAAKTVAKPATVKFETKSRQTVTFKALKTVKVRPLGRLRTGRPGEWQKKRQPNKIESYFDRFGVTGSAGGTFS